MRVFIVALLAQCGPVDSRPAGYTSEPGIVVDESTSTGEPPGGLRLDLPDYPPLPDLPAETSTGDVSTGGTSTGEPVPADLPVETGTSTGEASTGSTSTGPESTGEGSTSTGAGSTSTGEPEPGTSTGEPPEACGDGTCGPEEAAVKCFAPGWCHGDCVKAPHCITDCPCGGPWLPGLSPDNVCHLTPGSCSATKPGGYCDPNGDGAYLDANFTRGWHEHKAKCG